MGVFEELTRFGYGALHFCRDEATRLQALVAIHDTRLGPALGGCRFVHYDSEADALDDVLRLARAMTAKAALASLDHGGGKAVIIKPRGEFDREALFTRFGHFVDGLGGQYITTEDSGTKIEDMSVVRKVTSHVTGFAQEQGGSGDPSPFTALGVRRGIEAMVKVVLGRDALEGLVIAVQGIGHVGYALCRELHQAGAQLVVADVNAALCEQAVAEFSARVSSTQEIHRVTCDVFAPCALGGAINAKSVNELQCRIVAGAANNQLATPQDGEKLMNRGIAYAPDYAINAGGLINVADEVLGYSEERATARTMAIYDTIVQITEQAQREGRPPQEIADKMVAARLAAHS